MCATVLHFCVHNVYFNVMVHSIPNKYSLIADRNLVAGGMYTALTIESQNSGLQLQSILVGSPFLHIPCDVGHLYKDTL